MSRPQGRRPSRALVVLFCTVLQVCFGTVYAWSYFGTILVRQYDWTHSQTSLAFSITIFCLGISAAWAGSALPRVGPRKLALIGSVMFAIGYVVAGVALRLDMVPLFYVGYGAIGGAGIGFGYVTPVATAVKWFPERKGLVAGIVVMGFGVGAFILSKGFAPFLVEYTDGDLPRVFMGLGLLFALILIPSSLVLANPPGEQLRPAAQSRSRTASYGPVDDSVRRYLASPEFAIMWVVFFFNVAAGISVISFQSELLQEVWGYSDPTVEPATLAAYGATLIAVSSIFNGLGRLLWGVLSDRLGRVLVFRILLASQMIVFGLLMTESNPWVFSAMVCYVLLCFGGGFATMPSFVLEVFGAKRMSAVYGAILTAWAAAGIVGPMYVGYLKDTYPDRAVMYCFLVGILMLGAGYVFSCLLNDDRIRLERPTIENTLRRYGIPVPDER